MSPRLPVHRAYATFARVNRSGPKFLPIKVSLCALAAVSLWGAGVCFGEEAADKLQLDFANGLYDRQYYPMAAEEYGKFLKDFPNAAKADEATFRLAESLRLQKKGDEALPVFQTLTEKFPNSQYWQKAKFRVGELNYLAQKYADATTHLQQLVPKATDKEIHAAALFLLGKIQYDQGQLDPAAQALLSLAQSG